MELARTPRADEPDRAHNDPPRAPERRGTEQIPEFTLTDHAVPAGSTLPVIGDRINQYEIIRELGRGGMGAIYLARDTKLARRVALKCLLSTSRELTERLIAESRATARCTHENIVVIHEVNEYCGNPFMVLEYLRGHSLRHHLRDQKLTPQRALELIIPVVRALQCAHQHKIVHRDLKPDNIFVTSSNTVKVLDFGIAKFTQRAAAEGAHGGEGGRVATTRAGELELANTELPARTQPLPPGATNTGALIGTLPYMSPEQMSCESVDHRTDLWAVGIVLWEMVTGRHPLAPLTQAKLTEIADLDRPMPSIRELAPELGGLARVIDHCLRKRTSERVASARELLTQLDTLASDKRSAVASSANRPPFTGLAAFQESDAQRFFGRAHDIASVVARVRSQPLMTLVGPSGVGKSSLIRAGVIPALKRSGEGWEAFVIRPGRRPIASLARVLTSLSRASRNASGKHTPATHAARLRTEPGSLGAALRARASNLLRRIVLFVDQFEELYTLGADAAERAAFVACLEGAADDATSPIRVVLSMRSDFLDRLASERAFMSEVTRGLVLLPAINRDGLREALTRPIEDLGYRFETPALVESMLDALDGTPGALPLLQFTAAKLWDMRDRERWLLTRDSYEAIGGVAGTLASHADAVLTGIGSARLVLARAIVERLVTPERTRAIASVRELRELDGDPDELEQVIAYLAEARLVVLERGTDGDDMAVELIHESLITGWPTLNRWLDEHKEDAAMLARLRVAAQQWDRGGRRTGMLWRGEAVLEARLWRDRYTGTLARRDQAYLDAVFAHANRAARARRVAIIAIIGFLSALVVATTVALNSIRRAERSASQMASELNRQVVELTREQERRSHVENELQQALRDAREARQKAERDKQQADRARDRAERESSRAEKAEKQAREDFRRARHASQKALQAERSARAAAQAASDARQRAERAREEAEQAREKLRENLEQEQKLLQLYREEYGIPGAIDLRPADDDELE